MVDHTPTPRVLEGIRVFDLGVAIAGPVTARYLGHFGAEVIKVESRDYPDLGRNLGATWLTADDYGRDVLMDSSPGMGDYNAGKLSVGLDLKKPEARAAAKRLLAKCDVVVSNFTVRAMESLGLDYESVKKIKPDIIYLQLTGYGATSGPYSSYVAWGKNLLSLTGLDDLTGFKDRPPAAITGVAYADQSNGLHGLMAVIAAIDYRRRTGEGQFIDLSQFEATVGMLGPWLLDYAVNGCTQERSGNRLSWTAPQGVYPCRGKDRWVAISVFSEDEWWALCEVAGHPAWAEDPRFETVQARLANHDELDVALGEWTAQHTNAEVAEWLQRAGVAAAPVQDQPGIALDPQLLARNFWQMADSHRFGKDFFTGQPILLSETPGGVDRACPSLGEDNAYVLGDLCGYSETEIAGMIEGGAVYPLARPDFKLKRPYLNWIRHFMPDLPWPGE